MLDERRRDALAPTRFSALPEATQHALVDGSAFVDVPAGHTFMPAGPKPPFVCIVIEGLVRTYLVAAGGAQLTVRYTRPGDINAVTSLYAHPLDDIAQQAVTRCELLELRPDNVIGRAKTDVALANVLMAELAERASSYARALACATLATTRENVVRQLLDHAVVDPADQRIAAHRTDAAIADDVGAVCDAVERILLDLQERQLVLVDEHRVVLLDPERLHDETWPAAHG